MDHKRGQHGLRGTGRPSFLGNGLLERVRATSLALLGATAAVGLSIVALAFNQGWPLVAGSSIPPLPRQERAVGPASALSQASPSRRGPAANAHGDSRRDRTGPAPVAPVAADAGPGVGAPTGVVVSSSEPVEQSGGDDHSGGADHVAPKPPAKAPVQPQPVQQPPATTVVSSPPAPEPAPAPPPEPAPAPTVPVASASEAPPEESGPPPWSHGGGHGYGRGDDWHDHDGGGGED
ncbi:MAG TPA: hypothetical protein VFN89_09455 [Solirubrobacterales bacterium]|nr:hypothetical protein [Solirubrobacterales bacterium]